MHLEKLHFAHGIAPVADYCAGDVFTDIVNMKNFGKAYFVIQKGVGTTGVSTIIMQACDDTSASNTTDIPFRYRFMTSPDDPGSITEVAATGFSLTAGSNHIAVIEVDAVEVAKTGYGYLRMSIDETTDDPVLAGVLVMLAEPRYSTGSGDTALT